MTTTSTMRGMRDVLMEFATEGEPTPRRLETYAKEHPELRRELTELAVEMVLEPARTLPAADASTRKTVSSAWARFQAGIKSEPATTPVPNAARMANVFRGLAEQPFHD